jgi:aminodeoxyfutalosine synthase
MQNNITSRTKEEQQIAETVLSGGRISNEQALYLYQNSDSVFCGWLADKKRRMLHQNKAFYNKNIHVEITNICLNKCKFCSFYRQKGQEGAWDLEKEDVLAILTEKVPEGITEVHFTGGLHPEKSTVFYADLFAEIKSKYPQLHIKAFTAVEIEYFAKADKLSLRDVLVTLKSNGLNSLAGGGAEILDDKIRKKLCPEKTDSQTWLNTHRIAHELGMKTNCTMLYGHIESFADRILHMQKLRDLQDDTNGFNCFIPLKYKTYGNRLGITTEISLQEELKNYAISRLYLDNIPHLKAYWPMCGKETALLAMSFGADDFDGTISNTTKIYSMAGSEQNPGLNDSEITELLNDAGFKAVERDSEYRELLSFIQS